MLSYYNEIENVKAAMKLGAEDYILKLSMEDETLLNVLTKTGEAIIRERERDAGPEKSDAGSSEALIKETLYKNYIKGAVSYEKFKHELDNINISPAVRYINSAVICCKIDDFAAISLKSSIEDRNIHKFSLVNIMDSALKNYAGHEILEIENGRYIIIIDFEEHFSKSDIKKSIKQSFSKITASLKKYLNITVSLGVTLQVNDISVLKQKYLESAHALEHGFFSGKESLIFFDEITEFSEKDLFLDVEQEKRLIFCLENMDSHGLRLEISNFMNYVEFPKRFTPVKIRIAMVEILHLIMKNAKKHGADIDGILKSSRMHPINTIMNADTLTEIKNWFDTFTIMLVEAMRLKKIRPEILKLKKYILEHLKEPISLDIASRVSNLSKNYLSSLFKKETGEGLLEYVNRLKMEKSREILQTSTIKIQEVANRVGISDEAYFSKLFKKYNGISPNECRRQNKKVMETIK